MAALLRHQGRQGSKARRLKYIKDGNIRRGLQDKHVPQLDSNQRIDAKVRRGLGEINLGNGRHEDVGQLGRNGRADEPRRFLLVRRLGKLRGKRGARALTIGRRRRGLAARSQSGKAGVAAQLRSAVGIPLRARGRVETDDDLGAAAERVQDGSVEGAQHNVLVEHGEVAVLAQALGDPGRGRDVANVGDGPEVDGHAGQAPGLAPASHGVLVGAAGGVVGLRCDSHHARDGRQHDEEVERVRLRELGVQVPGAEHLGSQAAAPDGVAQQHGALDDAAHRREAVVLAGPESRGQRAGEGNVAADGLDSTARLAQFADEERAVGVVVDVEVEIAGGTGKQDQVPRTLDSSRDSLRPRDSVDQFVWASREHNLAHLCPRLHEAESRLGILHRVDGDGVNRLQGLLLDQADHLAQRAADMGSAAQERRGRTWQRVEHDVDAASLGGGQNSRGEGCVAASEDALGRDAVLALDKVSLLLRPGRGVNVRYAEALGQHDGGLPDGPGRGVDEHRLPGRQTRRVDEAGVRKSKSQGKRRGLDKVHAVWYLDDAVPRDAGMAGKGCAGQERHDTITDIVALCLCLGTNARDDACTFKAHGAILELAHGGHGVARANPVGPGVNLNELRCQRLVVCLVVKEGQCVQVSRDAHFQPQCPGNAGNSIDASLVVLDHWEHLTPARHKRADDHVIVLLVFVVPGDLQDAVTLGVLELGRTSLRVGTAESLFEHLRNGRDGDLAARGPSLGGMCRIKVQGEKATADVLVAQHTQETLVNSPLRRLARHGTAGRDP
ncbi:hypothetical protein VCV18_011304 [Metarhizium anisopliae]